jgi:Domain of unknown function (DUF1844)
MNTPDPDNTTSRSTPEAAQDLDPRVPPASFTTLLTMLASQAFVAMGRMPDPVAGKPLVRPRMARHFIDMVSILDEKTKGNLTKEEAEAAEAILHELRMTFVAVTKP